MTLRLVLPLALVASPWLTAAVRAADAPSDDLAARSRYEENCNAETYEANQLVSRGRGQRVDAIAHPTDPSSRAIVTTEQELSIFSRERLSVLSSERLYTAVRQLLLSNPYADESVSSEQAASNCMALSGQKMLIAQSSDPLPILGPVDAAPAENPSGRPSSERPSIEPRPSSVEPSVEPSVEQRLVEPTAVTPVPSQPPAALPQPPASASVDPTNITPTQLNPTPFDGAPISTLSSRPDGNYRYVAGETENSAYTDAALQQRNGAVIVLRKEGNRVVGALMPRFGEPGVCITGIVSGDRIIGTETSARFELDLSEFSMINAGSALPPKSCDITATVE